MSVVTEQERRALIIEAAALVSDDKRIIESCRNLLRDAVRSSNPVAVLAACVVSQQEYMDRQDPDVAIEIGKAAVSGFVQGVCTVLAVHKNPDELQGLLQELESRLTEAGLEPL